MKTPILGSDYVARSVNAVDNRMVNLFPEIIPEGGKEPAFLSRCPGMNPVSRIGDGTVIRGVWFLGDSLYVVGGDTFYRLLISDLNTATFSATITGTTNPISMSDNGTQVFVAGADSTGISYVFTPSTNTLTTLTPGVSNFPGAVSVCFIDGFFIVNEPNTQKVWVSSLYDGTTWSSTDFASAEQSPDNVVGLIANNGELWVFGENSTEVWYNAGNAGFPFAPIQGAFMELGCAAPYSIAKMDNAVFWIGSDQRGNGIVYKTRGYSGERVSTHAIEWQLQNNGQLYDLSNAVAYTYQQNGHFFYVLNETSLGTTFVYDSATESWHERQSYVPLEGIGRHLGNCYTLVPKPYNGTQNLVGIVGSYKGSLFFFDPTDYTDDSNPQTWIRSWRALPTGQNNLTRTAHHSLQIDFETGFSPNPGDPTSPQVSLRWSDDGGNTWSNYHALTIGTNGTYNRLVWRRLGMTMKLRDRVYEVSGSDACPIFIMGAELVMSPTNA